MSYRAGILTAALRQPYPSVCSKIWHFFPFNKNQSEAYQDCNLEEWVCTLIQGKIKFFFQFIAANKNLEVKNIINQIILFPIFLISIYLISNCFIYNYLISNYLIFNILLNYINLYIFCEISYLSIYLMSIYLMPTFLPFYLSYVHPYYVNLFYVNLVKVNLSIYLFDNQKLWLETSLLPLCLQTTRSISIRISPHSLT